MIQFNLLPDVKKEYIRVKRTKKLIFTISIFSAFVSLGIVFLLFSFVQIGQKNHINNQSDDIKEQIKAIQSVKDLEKILTIQNQLVELPGLHQQKPESSRIFNYLNQVTPVEVKLQTVDVDFVNSTMKLTGTAISLADVNRYADTLKFVTYKDTGDNASQDTKVFSNVVSELSRNQVRATYTITLTYDKNIFDNTKEIVLTIPEQITTRSIVGRPELGNLGEGNSLFEDAPIEEEQ